MGLAVPVVTAPEQELVSSRDHALAARVRSELWPGLAATRMALTLTVPFGVAALIARAWVVAGGLLGWGVVVAVARIRAGRRAVL